MLSKQSFNATMRGSSDRDKELYILSSLAEIEIENNFMTKVNEIFNHLVENKSA